MNYIRIKNWDKFQQYKDRGPKWIKLYRDLLDNYEYCHLPDNTKSHLLGIWLLAAILDNKIPADPGWIGKRIGATTKINLEILKSTEFIESYSSVQDCTDSYSSVPREEKNREDKNKRFVPPTSLEVEEYGKSIGYNIDGTGFVASYEQKGWMVGKNKMVSWKAAVRNWKTNGWGSKPGTNGGSSKGIDYFAKLDYAKSLNAMNKAGDQDGVTKLFRKIRDNFGPGSVDLVKKEALTQAKG